MAREFTTEQQELVASMLPEGGKVELVVDTTVTAAEEFAGKFAGVFASRGWDVDTIGYAGGWGATPTGLIVMSQGDLPLSEVQQALVAALEAAEMPFNQLDTMLAEGVDVRLAFGRVGA